MEKRLAIFALVFAAMALPSAAKPARRVAISSVPLKPRPPLSDFIYGLASGPSWSTEFAVAGRLAALAGMDQEMGPHGESGPKIASLIEASEERSIDDLLTSPTTDLAILTIPTLERSAAQRPAIRQRIAYVAPLYLEAVHVLAHTSVADLASLAGKRVIIGSSPGTGQSLFDALGIKIEPVDIASGDALDAVKAGRADAAVLVSGKPVTQLAATESGAGLHLLPIPYSPALEKTFVPTTLIRSDYPGLVDAMSIPTVAVPAILAAYRWPPRSERAQTLGVLVATILNHLADEGSDLPALKLKEVNWAASYPGWERLPIAAKWLQKHAPVPSKVPLAGSPGVPTPPSKKDGQ